jgi:hypothetical protein
MSGFDKRRFFSAFFAAASVINAARAINVGKAPERSDLERIGIDQQVFQKIRIL